MIFYQRTPGKSSILKEKCTKTFHHLFIGEQRERIFCQAPAVSFSAGARDHVAFLGQRSLVLATCIPAGILLHSNREHLSDSSEIPLNVYNTCEYPFSFHPPPSFSTQDRTKSLLINRSCPLPSFYYFIFSYFIW